MRLSCALIALLLLSSCIVHRLEVTPVPLSAPQPTVVETPVKAHLKDGATIVYKDGLEVRDGTIFGAGMRYDLGLQNATSVSEVSVDAVAAMESYQTPVSTPATGAATVASTTGILVGGTLALFAIFGSCPTVYALDGDPLLPDAELFSYSIAPAFQGRDIDALGLAVPHDGVVSLEIRNEMLETHYIDQVELVEVTHGVDEAVLADQHGRPIVVSGMLQPYRALDQDGRNVLAAVTAADGNAWRTPDERLQAVNAGDFLDTIDLEFDVPAEADDVTLVLKLRNSLLNTVLFYDVMLAEQGYAALDWLGRDINELLARLNVGLWYRASMGLDIQVFDGERYRSVGRLADQGPIAWSERAVVLPALSDSKTLRVRLAYVTDNWRIDQVALALDSRATEGNTVSVARAVGGDGALADVPDFLSLADERYLVTRPGEHVRLEFDVGESAGDSERSYLLASSGYYIEWMRPEWLRAQAASTFVGDDAAILRAIDLYAKKRNGLRERFESRRVPVQ